MRFRKNRSEVDYTKDNINLDDDLDQPIDSLPDTVPDTQDPSYEDDSLFKEDLGFDDFGMGETTPPMEKHSDLLKQLTNFQPFIKEKINGWLGLRWDEETEKWINDPDITPIMNKKCAAWCIDYLKTYTRDNNIITNIGKEEYNNIVMDIIEVVWLDIGTRTEEFGIRKDGDLHRVCVELQHSAELILMGAGGGKYNELLSTATSRHESINLTPDSGNQLMGYPGVGKRPGVLGKIKKALVGG